MTVLSIGNVLRAGFDQIFNLYSPFVYSTGDIIDTFVYRMGILGAQFGPGNSSWIVPVSCIVCADCCRDTGLLKSLQDIKYSKEGRKNMKPTKGQRIFAVFNYILLTLLALLCLLPMLNIVALSFSSRNMVNAGAVTFLPKEFTISSYLYMLQKSGLIPALLVTVKRLVLGVVLNLIMTISVAYPLSKSEKLFKSRKFYVAFFLITMIFNGGIFLHIL